MHNPIDSQLFLPRIKPMLSERGQGTLEKSFQLSTISGIIRGFSLLALLPTLTSLIDGGASWGLPFGAWLVILFLLAIGGMVSEYSLAMNAFNTALDLLVHLHQKLGDNIAKIPLGWFRADSPGIFSRMVSKEMMMIGESIAHFIMPAVQNSISLIVVIIGSFIWDWRLGLVLLLSLPILIGLIQFSRWCHNNGKLISEPAEVELAARLVEYGKCQGTIRSCGLGEHYPQLTKAVQDDNDSQLAKLRWSTLGVAISGAFTQIIVVLMMLIAVILVTSEVLTGVEAIAYIGMCLRFHDVLKDIQMPLLGLEDRRPTFDMIEDVLTAPLLPEVEHSEPLTETGRVEIKDVHFGYLQQEPVLNGVSIEVPARSMCAIVGPSGCGKTTVARLISRFYDVDSGSIKVSGVDVRDQTTEDLMRELSMVFQDVYLFDDTLEANIRVGREDASQEDVQWAARLAGVEEIVRRLPDGYQTLVGEGGRALSGGERQRVSVARALLKRAPIVLFDEATSALDAENEANIVSAMQELRQRSTLIVIAHKLDTIRTADQVVVMAANGTIAQVGTHESLVKEPGPYQNFWARREQAEGWQLV